MADERSPRRVRKDRKEVTTRMPVWLAEGLADLAAKTNQTVNDLICSLCEGAVLGSDDEVLARQAERDTQRAIQLLERALRQISSTGARVDLARQEVAA